MNLMSLYDENWHNLSYIKWSAVNGQTWASFLGFGCQITVN